MSKDIKKKKKEKEKKKKKKKKNDIKLKPTNICLAGGVGFASKVVGVGYGINSKLSVYS